MASRRMTLTSIGRSIRIRPRLYLGALSGLAVLALLPHWISSALRATAAWDVGGGVYLISTCLLMQRARMETIRAHAARQDDGAVAILVLILLAIGASFGVIAALINEAKAATEFAKVGYVALAALTIFVSWTVTQVAFALHYAREYYVPDVALATGGAPTESGGLMFPNDQAPDFWDFFYFSTSIGATSQTSDVAIKSKTLRRLVTVHAIVSFFFNTTVLALTINLAASLI